MLRWNTVALMLSMLILGPPLLAGSSTLRISLVDSDGEALEQAYIGIVPNFRPWNDPVHECIAPDGFLEADVSPGEYFIVATAAGFETRTEAVTVSNEALEVKIELAPAPWIEGRVLDRSNNPLSSARVANPNLAGDLRLSDVTPLAASVHASNWSTLSDEEGKWYLRGSSSRNYPILIEVPSHAPGWVGEATEGSSEIRLEKGGTLELEVERPDSSLVVTLKKLEPVAPNDIAAGYEGLVWARGGGEEKITWNSLAAGKYRVVALHPDPAQFVPPSEILTIELRAGEVSRAIVALPDAAPQPPHRVLHVLRLPSSEVRHGQAFVRSDDGRWNPAATVVTRASRGNLVHVRTDHEEQPVLVTTKDWLILPSLEVTEPEGPDATEIHPLAGVEMTLRVREGLEQPMPQTAFLGFSGCRGTQQDVVVEAPVEVDGGVHSVAPAECRALLVRVAPFEAPMIEQRLARGQTARLGTFVLDLGSGIEVSVLDEASEEPIAGATVRVAGLNRNAPSFGDAVTDDEGVARMEGLPAARPLILEAEHPETSVIVHRDIRLEQGKSNVLEPVLMPGPATLIVEPVVGSSTRRHFPDASVTTIVLSGPDGSSTGGEPDGNGTVIFRPLSPGEYGLMAILEAGGDTFSIGPEAITLESSEEHRLRLTLDPPMFRGEVRRNGKGLPAQLQISDPRAGIIRPFKTDPEGRFLLVLPEPGTYGVEVHLGDHAFKPFVFPDVELFDPQVPLILPLPSTDLQVRVADDEDRPLRQVKVTARSWLPGRERGFIHEISEQTDSEGIAMFPAVDTGEWVVSAEHRDTGKAETTVTITEGEGVKRVVLRLEGEASLEGSVVDDRGLPAPAEIRCLTSGSIAIPETVGTRTSREGEFRLTLAPDFAGSLSCTAITLRGEIALFSAHPRERVTVRIPRSRGMLRIKDWNRQRVPWESLWLVSQSGEAGALSWLGDFSRIDGSLQIWGLPSGTWRIVRSDSLDDRRRLARGEGASLRVIERAMVSAGAEAEVSIFD